MFLNLAKLILSFFDLLDRKKILSYFKRNIKGQLKCCIDVGAHHGQSIKSFNKVFKIEIKADQNADYGQKYLKWTKKDGWTWVRDDNITKMLI